LKHIEKQKELQQTPPRDPHLLFKEECLINIFPEFLRHQKKLFAEGKIISIIEIRGGFLLSYLNPGDGIRGKIKNHRYNNPPICKKMKGGDKAFYL
jgi:hypothetical protein